MMTDANCQTDIALWCCQIDNYFLCDFKTESVMKLTNLLFVMLLSLTND